MSSVSLPDDVLVTTVQVADCSKWSIC